jgi:hypothetical protein
MRMIYHDPNLTLEEHTALEQAVSKQFFSWMAIFVIIMIVFEMIMDDWRRSGLLWADFFTVGYALLIIAATYAVALLLFPALDGKREVAALDELSRDRHQARRNIVYH